MAEGEKTSDEQLVTGPELFDRICQLGIGRFYFQKEAIPQEPKPKKEDTLGRLERLFNGAPEKVKLVFSPFAIALPVNPEETSHIIVFNDGQMVLVKVYDPKKEAESNEYAFQFSTKYSGRSSMIDEIIHEFLLDPTRWVSLLKQRSNLSFLGNFTLVDPLDDEESMRIVLAALTEAKKVSTDIKEQREKRKIEFISEAAKILSQQSL